jgi:hypothetical protein
LTHWRCWHCALLALALTTILLVIIVADAEQLLPFIPNVRKR